MTKENSEDGGLRAFLEEVSLLTDIDRWNESDKAVTLMTIHSAKGLEFPVVILVGLEEGLFPLGGSAYELDDLEEERRLFYVALTRAEQKVYMSHANTRRRFGGPPIPTTQSRFLHELPSDMLDFIDTKKSYVSTQHDHHTYSLSKNKIKSSINEFSIGDKVEHKLFGRGKILAVEGVGETAKLTIQFAGNIRKKLIAKYANLNQLQF